MAAESCSETRCWVAKGKRKNKGQDNIEVA